MGWGTGNLGGGSGGLNFKVVAGLTQPGSATGNTIWVMAENMTGWIFSASEPAEPVEGIVWISTGTGSHVEFNALKKNGIQVYPLYAKQYVGSAWVDVTAMSYQDGEWVEWFTGEFLYRTSGSYKGNWNGYNYKKSGSSKASYAATVTTNGALVIERTSHLGSYGFAANDTPVDLTDKTTIRIKAAVSSSDAVQMRIMPELVNGYTVSAYLELTDTAETEMTLDVAELSGYYYVGFSLYKTDVAVTLTITEIEVE